MGASNISFVPCPWCRRAVPAENERCPHCGREMQQEGLRPMGDIADAPPAEGDVPLGERPAPRLRDPRAEFERRRAEREAEAERLAHRGYGEYLRHLIKVDQVFGLLLALMVLSLLNWFVSAARAAVAGEFWYLQGVVAVFMLAMLVGILTFQRWAHTVVVWLAGGAAIGALIGAFKLVVAPAFVESGLLLVWMWVNWVFTTAVMIFVLVVLCERSAYFEGAGARVEPKRTRLADFLRKEHWEKAGSRPDPELPQTAPRPKMASRPSQYAGPHAADEQRPTAGGGTMPTVERAAAHARAAMRPLPSAPQEASGQETERAEDEGLRPLGGPSAPPPPAAQPPPPASQSADSRYKVEPLPPAPGQAPTDWSAMRRAASWAHLKELAREDPLFGALLVALAAQGLLIVILQPRLWSMLGAVGLVWAVASLRRWAYYAALMLSSLLAFGHVLLLYSAYATYDGIEAGGLVYYLGMIAVNGFIALALLARREYFE